MHEVVKNVSGKSFDVVIKVRACRVIATLYAVQRQKHYRVSRGFKHREDFENRLPERVS